MYVEMRCGQEWQVANVGLVGGEKASMLLSVKLESVAVKRGRQGNLGQLSSLLSLWRGTNSNRRNALTRNSCIPEGVVRECGVRTFLHEHQHHHITRSIGNRLYIDMAGWSVRGSVRLSSIQSLFGLPTESELITGRSTAGFTEPHK